MDTLSLSDTEHDLKLGTHRLEQNQPSPRCQAILPQTKQPPEIFFPGFKTETLNTTPNFEHSDPGPVWPLT
jgi:hypothetical protein